ncbi:S-adenosyl-L-methionine-dependent methyltransferase [Polyplosphaeria fusca]|uniref:S-adenosyl-L-methionine-dependent methyltransferase n=1 Tax=Polyplosphaeria fusca TaxID=682080 RepID=A0A9P4V277_9PLEO|nr:S-adenosyl-L-methionine-dependent methyltransferase [Polyplosphaeria fusca]
MSYLSVLRQSLNANLELLEDELGGAEGPHLLDARPYSPLDDAANPPSKKTVELLEKIRVDLKAVDAIVTPSQFKVVDVANAQYGAAALGGAVLLDVAGAIEKLGGEASLEKLAEETGANEHKLGRILRTLTGEYIFQETSHQVFKNTRHSIGLSHPGARSFLSFITDLGMKSSSGIPKDLIDPETKNSFAETTAPFCKVVSKNGQTFAEYMGDPENAAMVALGNEGVVGWLNKLTRASLLNDYPWAELGNGTVIDLGCGAGDSGMDAVQQYPHLTWVYQDFEPVLESLKKDYPAHLSERVQNGTTTFVTQDYFQPNVSDGNAWYMRGVLHEYDDEGVLTILKHVGDAMQRTPGSKMIINEVLNSSPVIMPASSTSAPSECIPATQSALGSVANTMTWSTFSLFGGKERSYAEYEALLNAAGLRISRFFKFRTFTVVLEAVVNVL